MEMMLNMQMQEKRERIEREEKDKAERREREEREKVERMRERKGKREKGWIGRTDTGENWQKGKRKGRISVNADRSCYLQP